jgi:hypothetical protein
MGEKNILATYWAASTYRERLRKLIDAAVAILYSPRTLNAKKRPIFRHFSTKPDPGELVLSHFGCKIARRDP